MNNINSFAYARAPAVEAGLLIPHKEVGGIGGHDTASCPPIPEAHVCHGNPYKIIQPEIVPFISYPYEWCFSQLKDTALAMIRIQKQELNCNMSLKDASAYKKLEEESVW